VWRRVVSVPALPEVRLQFWAVLKLKLHFLAEQKLKLKQCTLQLVT